MVPAALSDTAGQRSAPLRSAERVVSVRPWSAGGKSPAVAPAVLPARCCSHSIPETQPAFLSTGLILLNDAQSQAALPWRRAWWASRKSVLPQSSAFCLGLRASGKTDSSSELCLPIGPTGSWKGRWGCARAPLAHVMQTRAMFSSSYVLLPFQTSFAKGVHTRECLREPRTHRKATS